MSGVPICDGTGLGIAAAVFECLKDWKILDYIDGVCFDTTGTNTGIVNGSLDSSYYFSRKHFLKFLLFS